MNKIRTQNAPVKAQIYMHFGCIGYFIKKKGKNMCKRKIRLFYFLPYLKSCCYIYPFKAKLHYFAVIKSKIKMNF